MLYDLTCKQQTVQIIRICRQETNVVPTYWTFIMLNRAATKACLRKVRRALNASVCI